jgi:tetratricopeptide (TPR) repeat protein
MVQLILIVVIFLFSHKGVTADEMSPELVRLSERWAEIKYDTQEAEREGALEKLLSHVEGMVTARPGDAAPMVWHAVVLSTLAEEQGGISGLVLVKRAKRLLEEAETIEPDILDGSIYTLLGSLYYQVPGWPVGFGNTEKAKQYLHKALDISPNDIDANFYYGDYLLRNKQYQSAIEAFEKALRAPSRALRPIADAGRRKEAQIALAEAKKQLQLESTD